MLPKRLQPLEVLIHHHLRVDIEVSTLMATATLEVLIITGDLDSVYSGGLSGYVPSFAYRNMSS